jgi:hypothetical protein
LNWPICLRNGQFAKIGQFVGTILRIGHFGELANSVLQSYIVYADEQFVGRGDGDGDFLDSGSFEGGVEDESFHFGGSGCIVGVR